MTYLVKANPRTIQRLKSIAERTKAWNDTPETMPIEVRETLAALMATTFKDFRDFAILGMKFLGFDTTLMQADIAEFMADQSYGKKKVVKAQRGEAKTTLAALYAIWRLIQNQSTRVLVVSGGENLAADTAVLIIRIINTWHLLCWLRADKSRGDRTSYEGYDVHCDLKPTDRSASIACAGITSNLAGKRADLLIADDIETQKNSLTQTMRLQLSERTKEFSAINTHGDILYLGTPQTKDSIYKELPMRGYVERIWCGRYPTDEELARYLPDTLAPMILEAMEADPSLRSGYGLDGTRGASTDLGRYSEIDLQGKELEYGPEGFSLQYMLDTTLSDALRTRIRLSDLIVGDYTGEGAPEVLWWAAEPRYRINEGLPDSCRNTVLYRAAGASERFRLYSHKLAIIDPAGSGGDEVAFAVMGASGSFIHLMSVGGLAGGMTEQNMDELLDIFQEFGVSDVKVEANMGHGVVSQLLKAHCEKRAIKGIGFEDYYAKGQKEKRIIDTISPVTRRHKLVVHTRAIHDDWKYCQLHARDKRVGMSVLYQMANITSDKGSLVHDDRLDCVQGGVMFLSALIVVDDEQAQRKRDEQEAYEYIQNPMGYKMSTERGYNREKVNKQFNRHRPKGKRRG